MKSTKASGEPSFAALQTRLITLIKERLYNGEFTERGLARLAQISQSQLHNVLKRERTLHTELADSLMDKLGLSVLDLMNTAELSEELHRRSQLRTAAKGLS